MGYGDVAFPEGTLFLVTGGAGFIGSNLCHALLVKGCRVRCLDNLSTGSRANVDFLLGDSRYEFVEGDIRNLSACETACAGVSCVLHQAAWGSVGRSLKDPLGYCENNIRGTLNVFEAARRCGVPRVVYASSSSVYGDDESLPKAARGRPFPHTRRHSAATRSGRANTRGISVCPRWGSGTSTSSAAARVPRGHTRP